MCVIAFEYIWIISCFRCDQLGSIGHDILLSTKFWLMHNTDTLLLSILIRVRKYLSDCDYVLVATCDLDCVCGDVFILF